MESVELPDAPQLHWFVADGVIYLNLCFAKTDELPLPQSL
jgi:hypothetical protein